MSNRSIPLPNPVLRLALLALVALGGGTLQAQTPPAVVASDRMATRDALAQAAVDFDRLAASSAYGESLRARARAAAVDVRRRLSEGDFRVGDQLLLRIEGQLMLDDTVTVLAGRRMNVRGFRQVDLQGVLRSELETKLRNELAENLTSVTVSVSPLVRVAVFGAVASPGYKNVPAELTLDRLLTRAGGLSATAATGEMTLQRADTVLLTGREVSSAVARGQTLGELGVLDGDALVIPTRGAPWDRNAVLQIGSFLLGIMTLLIVRQ